MSLNKNVQFICLRHMDNFCNLIFIENSFLNNFQTILIENYLGLHIRRELKFQLF